MSASPRPFGLIPALLGIAVALCWGCNFAASKYSLLHFPPFFTIFIRYVLVCLILAPFAWRRYLSLKQIFILSLLMITLHFTLVFTSLWLGLDIPTTVIAVQLGAPFSCVLGVIFLKDMLGPWRTVGMTVAFLGIVVVAGTPNVIGNEFAFALAIIGAMAWAGSNIYMKVVGQTPVMPLLFWTGLLSLPQTLLVSLILESNQWELVQTVPASAAIAITYSALASTITGYGLWYYLLKHYDVSQVAPYSLLVPIGGFASGWFFFDEHLTVQMMIGAALTIIGVAIITVRMPRRMTRDGSGI